MSRIFILGSGAWGTAIALSLHRRGGHEVTLWSHSAEEGRQNLRSGREYSVSPGFKLPAGLRVTWDCGEAASTEILVSVVPSEFLRPTLARIRPHLHAGQIVVSATKGVENGSLLRMSEVVEASLGEAGLQLPVGVLSGPTFAQEVAEGQPTALTIAFKTRPSQRASARSSRRSRFGFTPRPT